ncbi:MAG: hypothetical protein IAI49_10215, partial [Candidatus Eremiobacteraeota bacterium]|nr:hypothetical protein [Candidatus Eremiobacteraeota bacterium]
FPGWVPELVATQARENVGIRELWEAIGKHDAYLRESGGLIHKRREAFAHRVRALVMGDVQRRVDARIAALLELPAHGTDPYRAAEAIVERFAASGLPEAPVFTRSPGEHNRATGKGL